MTTLDAKVAEARELVGQILHYARAERCDCKVCEYGGPWADGDTVQLLAEVLEAEWAKGKGPLLPEGP